MIDKTRKAQRRQTLTAIIVSVYCAEEKAVAPDALTALEPNRPIDQSKTRKNRETGTNPGHLHLHRSTIEGQASEAHPKSY